MSNKVEIIKLDNKINLDDIKKNNNEDDLKILEEKPTINKQPKQPLEEQPEQPITIEDKLTKTTILNKIKRWKYTFPNLLEQYNVNHLEDKTIEELQNLEKEMNYVVTTHNSSNLAIPMANCVASIIENMSVFTPLKLKGYQQNLMNNEEFINVLKELSVQYSDYVYISPTARLGYHMVSTAILTNAINMSKEIEETKQKIKNKEIDKNIESKYGNL